MKWRDGFQLRRPLSNYGALTLRVQLHHRVEYLRTIPATVFSHSPTLILRSCESCRAMPLELPERDDELLMKLVRCGFSQRRKQLQNLLRPHVADWNDAAANLGFDPKARAEELSLAQWIGLANYIAPAIRPGTHAIEDEPFPVVDKTDRVLRYAGRSEVHGNNLRHRAVHILIFNEAVDVYLQQRSRWKDRHPLLWDSSAAGHVSGWGKLRRSGETRVTRRAGHKCSLEKLLKLSASPQTGQEFIWLYRGQLHGKISPNRSEIESGAFSPQRSWMDGPRHDRRISHLDSWNVGRLIAKSRERLAYLKPINLRLGKRRMVVRLNFRAARLAASLPP